MRAHSRHSSSLLLFLTFRQLLNGLFSFADVVHSELARLDKTRQDGLRSASEKGQKLIDQRSMGNVTRNSGFKNVRIPDLSNTPHDFFFLQTIDDGLDRRVCRLRLLWKCFLYIPNRTGSTTPQRFHDLQFEFGELVHATSSTSAEYVITTTSVCVNQENRSTAWIRHVPCWWPETRRRGRDKN